MQSKTASSMKPDEVRSILRSLMVSRKESSLTIHQLAKDFLEHEGEQIPWRQMGYASLFDYFQSIPNTLKVVHRGDTYYVEAIISDKVAHVSSLVSRQKSPHARFPSNKLNCYRRAVVPPRMQISTTDMTRLIRLVKENPRGIRLEEIPKLLNVNTSISHLLSQLNAVSHQVTIRDNYVYPAKKRTSNAPFVHSSTGSKKPSQHNQDQNVHRADVPKLPSLMDDIKFVPSGHEDDVEDDTDEMYNCAPAGYTGHVAQNVKPPSKVKKTTSSFIQETTTNYYMPDSKYKEYSPKKAREIEGDEGQQDTVEVDVYKDNLDACSDNESYIDLINERTKFRLEKLIQMYPEGINCADLPDKYYNEYKVSLPYTNCGFASVSDFAAHLPQIFHCVRPLEGSDVILFDAKQPAPDLVETRKRRINTLASQYMIYEEDEIEPIPPILPIDISEKMIPDGVMTYGESVGQVSVMTLKPESYVEVYIAEIYTPSLFFLQLRKKFNKLMTLMSDLNEFYSKKSSGYVIQPVLVEKGLNCTCVYNGEWHRALIKSVSPDGYATVMFYDYGTVKTYPITDLHYLHRSFSYLPAQGIPCGLFNVRPVLGDHWTRGVSCEFLELVGGKPLMAMPVVIDEENNSMLVSLVDTSTDEDFHINDWLVNANFAQFGVMGETVDLNSRFIEDDEVLANLTEEESTNLTVQLDPEECVNPSTNMPLISPQSTLIERPPFRAPPGLKLLPDNAASLSSILEENEHSQKSSNFDSTDMNDHSFTTNDTAYDKPTSKLTPEAFLQIWHQNLQLQMQINATFTALFPNFVAANHPALTNPLLSTLSAASSKIFDIPLQSSNPFKNASFENKTSYSQPTVSSTSVNVGTGEMFSKSYEFNVEGTNSMRNEVASSSSNFPASQNCPETCVRNQTTAILQTPSTCPAASYEHCKNSTLSNEETATFVEDYNVKTPLMPSYEYGPPTFEELKETNPFKQYLQNNCEVSTNVPPPIPERNPDLINRTFLPSAKASMRNGDEWTQHVAKNDVSWKNTKIVYAADPVMYNVKRDDKVAENRNEKSAKCEESRKHDHAQSPSMLPPLNENISEGFLPKVRNRVKFTWRQNRSSHNRNEQTSFQPIPASFKSRSPPPTQQPQSKISSRFESPVMSQVTRPITYEASRISPQELEFGVVNGLNQVDEGYLTRPPTSQDSGGSPVDETNEMSCDLNYNRNSGTYVTPNFIDVLPAFADASRTDATDVPTAWQPTMANEETVRTEHSMKAHPCPAWREENIEKTSNSQNNGDFGKIPAEFDNQPVCGANKPNFEKPTTNLYPDLTEMLNRMSVQYEKTIDEAQNKYSEESTMKNRFFNEKVPKSHAVENVINSTTSSLMNFALTGTNSPKVYELNPNLKEFVPRQPHKNAQLEPENLFCVVDLVDHPMYIFYLNREGWIVTDQFVETFTGFKTSNVMLSLLEKIGIFVPFKTVTRFEQPLLFSHLDGTILNVTRNEQNKLNKGLHLMPLNSALKLLMQLQIVSLDEVHAAMQHQEHKTSTALRYISKLIIAFEDFKKNVDKKREEEHEQWRGLSNRGVRVTSS